MSEFTKKFLEKHSDLFQALADGICCAGCGKIIRGEKYNLGPKYNWFEGCKECAEKHKEK